jgi:hypothetical protein
VDALIARALKKNPNERFPSAEAMRGECLRVAASFQAAPPSIVPGTQAQSGAGVGSAVFPPVDQATPAPSGQVQTPYQPTPPPNPYGTPTPSPAYGYPQQGGYQTPNPAAYSPQPGPSTPPPYNLTPQSGSAPSGGGRSNRPVIIGSVIVSVVAVGGLVTALLLNGGSEDDKGGGSGSASASASAEKKPGYRGPDTTRTIETTECTEPQESYNDPEKIELPDFKFKDIQSVKACAQAAGWQIDTKDVDENTYGDGTVMNQFPSKGTDVDPDDMPTIELNVSTGNPPS